MAFSELECSMHKIMLSCGELSGDEYGSDLVKSLKARFPNSIFRGMGGRNLADRGVELVVNSEKSASVMGFAELFGSFGKVFKALSTMKNLIKEWQPDVLIVIDYPEFNMRLARYARSLGIPVIYYIAPKVWAWRPGRVKDLARDTTKIAAIFPFEEKFLIDRGCTQASFVGNPLLERYRSWEKGWEGRENFLRKLGLAPERPVLSIFPGSRQSEIQRHLTIVGEALKIFKERNPQFQLVINVAPTIDLEKIKTGLPKDIPVQVVKCDSFSVLSASDIGLLKSGTSNLQAAVAGLPFAMFYVATSISAFIIRRVVKLTHYSLVNILKPNTVKEITQENATPANLAKEIEELWNDKDRIQRTKLAFQELVSGLDTNGSQSVTERVGNMVQEVLAG